MTSQQFFLISFFFVCPGMSAGLVLYSIKVELDDILFFLCWTFSLSSDLQGGPVEHTHHSATGGPEERRQAEDHDHLYHRRPRQRCGAEDYLSEGGFGPGISMALPAQTQVGEVRRCSVLPDVNMIIAYVGFYL